MPNKISYCNIVRNAACLSPSQMIRNTDHIIARAKRLIQSLYELNLLSAAEADQAKQEYLKFMSSVVVTDKEKFLSFDQDKDRLDSFFGSLMQANADLFNLWKVCRIIFVLSHGQADVERGFNINGELLVENMKELSLISQSIVFDHFSACKNDLHNYQVDKKLLLSCKGARMKYDNYLENEKKKQVLTEKSRKRKLITDEIVIVKKEKKDLLDHIASLDTDITKYSFEAEKKKDFTLLTKANAFRNTKTEKEKSVAALDAALEKLEKYLKALE